MAKKDKSLGTFLDSFTKDVPRGITSRYLADQRMPQACWQDTRTLYESAALDYDPDNPGGKMLIGALADKLIGINDNRHFLTVAGNRSGKSVGLVANLLFYDGSVIATDIKGELANITARRRSDLGQKVYVLDPFQIVSERIVDLRASYNPLSVLSLDSRTIIEDAEMIADALVITSDKDPHWDESAKHFIEGLCLHVVTHPNYATRRNLISVRQLIQGALSVPSGQSEDESEFFILFTEMLDGAERLRKTGKHDDLADAIEGAALDFFEKPDKERDSVLSTARRQTKLLDYSSMRSVLGGGDFDLADLKRDENGVTIYLCLPASRMGICSRWLRLFVNQLFAAMEKEQSVPDVPVLAALDEFPVLGYMKQLEDAVGQIASFGVRLWVILQDWNQGQALYKERWESFAANAGVMQFFGNVDLTTTEYISKKLDKTPVIITREGEASTEQREQNVTGKSSDVQFFDLLSPAEISQLFSRDDEYKRQVVFWSGVNPFILQRIEYFDSESSLHHYFKGKYDQPQ